MPWRVILYEHTDSSQQSQDMNPQNKLDRFGPKTLDWFKVQSKVPDRTCGGGPRFGQDQRIQFKVWTTAGPGLDQIFASTVRNLGLDLQVDFKTWTEPWTSMVKLYLPNLGLETWLIATILSSSYLFFHRMWRDLFAFDCSVSLATTFSSGRRCNFKALSSSFFVVAPVTRQFSEIWAVGRSMLKLLDQPNL